MAEVFRKSLLHEAAQKAGQRCRNGDEDPKQRRKHQAGNGNCFKRKCNRMCLVQMNLNPGDVSRQLNPANYHRGEQKGDDRQGADTDE